VGSSFVRAGEAVIPESVVVAGPVVICTCCTWATCYHCVPAL